MKKRISIFLIIVMMVFSLVSCAKCISTEYKTVEVRITNKGYTAMYMTPMKVGNTTIMQTHPATYRIYVEYNGIEYTISGSSTYHKYEDKIGKIVTGTLEIRSYDDGTVRYDIVSLE